MQHTTLAVALVASVIGTGASASLTSFLGETLTISNDFNTSIETVTVGAGAELGGGAFGDLLFSGESIDIADTLISFVFTGPIDVDFSFSGFSGEIDSIEAKQTVDGEIAGDPTVAADGKSFTLLPQADSNGGTIVYTVTWKAAPPPPPPPPPPVVPLPAGAVLLLTALAGLGMARRR